MNFYSKLVGIKGMETGSETNFVAITIFYLVHVEVERQKEEEMQPQDLNKKNSSYVQRNPINTTTFGP